MRSDDLSRFESRLTGDEGSVARAEQGLQRAETKLTQDDDFAAVLEGRGPDMRLAQGDTVGPFAGMSPGNSGLPAEPQVPMNMSDASPAQAPQAPAGPSLRGEVERLGLTRSPLEGIGEATARMFDPAYGKTTYAPGAQPGADPYGITAHTDALAAARNAPPPMAGGQPQPQSMQLSMPQPRFIAAHHDASMIPDTKGTIGQRFRNEADMGAAVQDERAAQMRQNKIAAANLQKQADDAEDRMIHRDVVEAQRQAYVAQKSAARDKAIDDASSGKEDPNRIFNNADTGTKIALGLGAFFGGIIPGVRPLMDMLGGNITRDIEAQRQDKHNKQWGAQQRANALTDDRGEQQNQRQYELTKEAQQWTLADKQIQAQMARTDDPILKAKAQEALVASRERVTAIKQEYDRLSYVRPQVVGGGGAVSKGLVVKLPDGRQVLAPNEKKFDELTTKSAQVTNIQSNINRAIALRKSANAFELGNPLSATHRQLAALQAETAQLVTVARGQGAMSKGDQEVADQAIGSMTGIMDNNTDVLRSTGARFGEQLSREADALGAEHVQTGYQVDANGRIQRDVALTGEADKPRPNMPKGKPVR